MMTIKKKPNKKLAPQPISLEPLASEVRNTAASAAKDTGVIKMEEIEAAGAAAAEAFNDEINVPRAEPQRKVPINPVSS